MHASWQAITDSADKEFPPSPLLANALYPLKNQAFLTVAGPDANKFLQGQLSCDIQQISLLQSSLGSHSNAKGRMQSSFRICLVDTGEYLLRMHTSILDHTRNLLGKYIVFSKAALEIQSDMVGIGLHGEKAEAALKAVFNTLPEEDYNQLSESGRILIRTSKSMKSFEVYTRKEMAFELFNTLSKEVPAASASQHTLVENYLGLAFVQAETVDHFIPQMFNYQCTPAISFRKGCYTGQEIVACMHYLGKVKRHMRHYQALCKQPLPAGTSLFSTGEQSVGDIVSSVDTGGSQWDLLINLTDDAAGQPHTLRTLNTSLADIQEIALPYPLTE